MTERYIRRGAYGVLVAVIYGVITAAYTMGHWIALATIGFLIGTLSSILDHAFSVSRLRRKPFLVVLGVRISAYLLLVLFTVTFITSLSLMIEEQIPFGRALNSFIPEDLLGDWRFWYGMVYSLTVLGVWQFVALISRLLGPNTLINYVMGKYHTPKEEARIFMFIDIRSSTTIAEKIGNFKWHDFLNDFFFDIAAPVRKFKGEIYQYVGDEVIISWPLDVGLKNLNCLRCFFGIEDIIDARAPRYIRQYGFKPIFKAGYHSGKVVVGIIGDYKRDIVFHGDTINTAARIQEACNEHNRRLLLSEELLNQLKIAGVYVEEYITNIRLRGKGSEIKLFSIDPVEDVVPVVRTPIQPSLVRKGGASIKKIPV